ncbi:MAG: bifunctional phosphopantothenoylcysteine decarboxylase/phosphopantothenate--cysteine ligase CoaBC [Acidobacteria bacterium]|nr:bifunctional phosphopantothenoylcysteine decarboxylase/phosphopantothenate--cysteine ligase CoaBC [Acidobacteriota bacterium]
MAAGEPLIGLGVSGGIGAYKAVEVARLLQKRGYAVQAILTRNARRFIGPLTFEAITRRPVITSQWSAGMNSDIEHIALATGMRALVVAPATANIIGKFANGIADDFLSALHLATRAPLLLAPAMNTVMWEHPAVQDNLARLVARGARIVEPGEGYLACGWVGRGRLAEPDEIAEAADRLVRSADAAPSTLAGRRILISAGPTCEDLDPVRFLGNRSSGRMGFAVAHEAMRRGASVHLVAGPTAVPPPAVSTLTRVRSAAEMHAAMMAASREADAVIMSAAVADYTPAGGASSAKIEKGGAVTLTLERTADILADLGKARGEAAMPVLVGFAAETGPPEARAAAKLKQKHVDLIVANDVTAPGAGFDVETNQVTLVSAAGNVALPLMSKADVAAAILDRVEALLAAVPAVRA